MARGATAGWLASLMPAWSIGGVYQGPDALTTTVVPSRAYDAVVYLRKVSPSRALPRPPPPKPAPR